jgi:hypothetical protein
MTNQADSSQQVAAAREAAAQARRLAPELTRQKDRARLLRYASELDRQATNLEQAVTRGE